METKKHYKMYKSGKLWVSAAVATLALTAGMAYGPSANADATQASAQPATQTAANPTTPAADNAAEANSQNKQGQADPQPTANNQNNGRQSTSGQNNKQDNEGRQTNKVLQLMIIRGSKVIRISQNLKRLPLRGQLTF